MCIRDRRQTERREGEPDAQSNPVEHYANCPTDSAFPGLAAVSYTHLRAHETVLDLVCRLLLEKKKHQHT